MSIIDLWLQMQRLGFQMQRLGFQRVLSYAGNPQPVHLTVELYAQGFLVAAVGGRDGERSVPDCTPQVNLHAGVYGNGAVSLSDEHHVNAKHTVITCDVMRKNRCYLLLYLF